MKLSEALNKLFSSYPLGKFMGVDVYLHWSWWVMFLFLLVLSPVNVICLLGLFVIITLHELGHCWAAQKCGCHIEEIVLYIIGGVARISNVNTLKKELYITIAGPMVNVLLIPFLYVCLKVAETSFYIGYPVADVLFWGNLMLLVFNLLPVYPLDGGRIFRAFMSKHFGVITATKYALMITSVFSIFIGIYGVIVYKPLLVVIALMLYYLSQESENNVQYENSVITQETLRASQQTLSQFRNTLDEINKNHSE